MNASKPQILAWTSDLFYRRPDAANCSLLLIILWLACYVNFTGFGLYMNDFTISAYWGQSWQEIWRDTDQYVNSWQGGRPLFPIARAIFGYTSWLLGGLPAAYLMGYAGMAANVLLIYALVRRIAPREVAFVAAIMWIVYPGDASKINIIRASQIQVTMTISLLSIWLYLHGPRYLSYIAILGSIGLYEFGVLPFLFAPLLRLPWRQALIKKLTIHLAITLSLLAGAILFRSIFAPGRLESIIARTPSDFVLNEIFAMFTGTATSAALLIARPITALFETNFSGLLLTLFIFFLLIIGLRLFRERGNERDKPISTENTQLTPPAVGWRRPLAWSAPVQLLVVGCIMWVSSYALFIAWPRFPPIALSGRETVVHAPSMVGISILAGGAYWYLASVSKGRRGALLAAAYLALLANFQFVVQLNFVDAWDKQKQMWRQVLELAPDLDEGTLVVIERGAFLRNNPYAKAYARTPPYVFGKIFHFPDEWESPPIAFFKKELEARWYGKIRTVNGKILYRQFTFVGSKRQLTQGNVIYLKASENGLIRKFGVVTVGGIELKLKERGPSRLETFSKGPLYRLMISP